MSDPEVKLVRRDFLYGGSSWDVYVRRRLSDGEFGSWISTTDSYGFRDEEAARHHLKQYIDNYWKPKVTETVFYWGAIPK